MNRVQLATAGLFAAWLAHDLEELATMSDNSRTLVTRLPGWLPMPASVREHGLTDRYVATGVAAVGLIVAAAAVRGYRTQGSSAFYQNAVLGFGLHGLGHLGVSLLTRGYVSGVATSPTIVTLFWLWATRALNQAGVPNRRRVPAALALAAGSIATGHLVAPDQEPPLKHPVKWHASYCRTFGVTHWPPSRLMLAGVRTVPGGGKAHPRANRTDQAAARRTGRSLSGEGRS